MVVGLIVKSLIGAYYQEKGAQATRKFIHDHFLSRTITVADHLHYIIKRPRALLLRVLERLGRGRPIARILKESGRESGHAVFVVGLFIRGEKISEGYGDSLAMAEIRATRRAIEDHYLREVQAVDVPLPSDDLMDIQEPTFFEKS
jgi:dsRNA-specific ribonuclease